MAVIWGNRMEQPYSDRENNLGSFREHADCMRKLRRSHDFLEHAEAMRAFRMAHPENWKNWGQRMLRVKEDLLALAPIQEVVPAAYQRN
jgi:hypothetical protein